MCGANTVLNLLNIGVVSQASQLLISFSLLFLTLLPFLSWVQQVRAEGESFHAGARVVPVRCGRSLYCGLFRTQTGQASLLANRAAHSAPTKGTDPTVERPEGSRNPALHLLLVTTMPWPVLDT